MNVINKLCCRKSQKCNVLQKQHGIYLRFNHLSQQDLTRRRKLEILHVVKQFAMKYDVNLLTMLYQLVDEAIEQQSLLAMVIDDYTLVHTKGRPTAATSTSASMCTIICRLFPDIKAIQLTPTKIFKTPQGVSIEEIENLNGLSDSFRS